MEEITTKSGMPIGMVVGISVLVAIVFGGGAYAYANNKAEKENTVTTYSHPELEYSLTLPAGYIGVDRYDCEGACSSNLTFAKKVSNGSYSESNVSLVYYKFSDTLDKEVADYRNANKRDIMEESDVKINGIAAKKFKLAGMVEFYNYIAVSNGYLLIIEQYESGVENQKVVDSIISSFQFTK